MGMIKKAITYAVIFSVGASVGGCATKCNMERKYEVIPKEKFERVVEDVFEKSSEYIKLNDQEEKINQKNYSITLDEYVK
jgi:hypothetical protein